MHRVGHSDDCRFVDDCRFAKAERRVNALEPPRRKARVPQEVRLLRKRRGAYADQFGIQKKARVKTSEPVAFKPVRGFTGPRYYSV